MRHLGLGLGLGLASLWACANSTTTFQGTAASGSTASSSSAGGAAQTTAITSAGQGGSAQGGAAQGGSSQGGAAQTTSGAGGMAGCNPKCQVGFSCCDGSCVNANNDILNCGTCGKKCDGTHPFCNAGTCDKPPCNGVPCAAILFCCGSQCCSAGQLCCDVPGPVASGVKCYDPVNGTCPGGCPGCKCAAPDTPIATPDGERPIAELREGDLVYSVDRGAVRAVRVAAVRRLPVSRHHVMRIALANGRTVSISPEHPLADGRFVRDLAPGDLLHGVEVESAALVPYERDATYDILPASDTGSYFAGGALVGSTMFGPVRVPEQCLSP